MFRSLPREWEFLSYSGISLHVMEPVFSLLCSSSPPHIPVTHSVNSFDILPYHFFKTQFHVIYHLRFGLPRWLFLSEFSIKALYLSLLSCIRATCTTHLILLCSITLIISGENKIHESPYYFVFFGSNKPSFLNILPQTSSIHVVPLTISSPVMPCGVILFICP
jgi:hypothetical protein